MKRKLKEKLVGITDKFLTRYLNIKDKNRQGYDNLLYIFDKYVNNAVIQTLNFDFNQFSKDIIDFVRSLSIDSSPFAYRYAPSVPKPNIYNSTYACLLYHLLNKANVFSNDELSTGGGGGGANFNDFKL
jgi:hypothetical protein